MVKHTRSDSRRLFDEPSLGDNIEQAFRNADPNRGTERLVYDPPIFASLARASLCPYVHARGCWSCNSMAQAEHGSAARAFE
jgi:hypothetical protein